MQKPKMNYTLTKLYAHKTDYINIECNEKSWT